MKTSEMLRKLAGDVRVAAAKRAEDRRTKSAQVITAAAGLGLLRAKLGGFRG